MPPMQKALCAAALYLATACATQSGVPRPSPAPDRVPPASLTSPSASNAASPPVSPRYPYPPTRTSDTVDVLHGVRVADPYRWLEDGSSEEVRHWAQEQNAFTRAWLDRLPEREPLRQRFRELYDIERVGPPLRRGQRYFWRQKDVGREKDALYFRLGKHGEKQVLLDPNTWSADGSVSLGGHSVS